MESYTGLFNQEARAKGKRLSDVELQAAKLKELDQNLARYGDSESTIGRIAIGSSQGKEDLPENRKKKADALHTMFLRMQEHQRWLLKQMDGLQEQIDALTKEIEEYSRNIEVLDDTLKTYKLSGDYDLGGDGYPENDRVRELIQDYEARTGQKWDAHAARSIEILRAIIVDQVKYRSQKINLRSDSQNEWDSLNEAYQNTSKTLSKLADGEYISETELQGQIEMINMMREAEQLDLAETPNSESVNLDNLPTMKL